VTPNKCNNNIIIQALQNTNCFASLSTGISG
jgi:hypothetical protein